MSTQNTKISASKLKWGMKLPFEQSNIGNGYASPGEVKTYHLTPEELAKYGPIKYNGRKPDHMYEIHKKNKGEVEDVGRLDEARAKLSREQYVVEKEKGIGDRDIMLNYFGVVGWDTLNKLKKEWGLIGVYQPGKAVKKVDPAVEAVPPVMIVDLEIFNKDRPEDVQPAKIKAIDGDGNTIMEFGSELIKRQEITALAAADEFYTLQEELDDINKLLEIKLARMQLLKEALEKVVVVI